MIYWQLVILCFAVANGAFREAVLIPSLGKTGGLILSGVLLSCLVALVAYILVRRKHGIASMEGLYIGILWLCLTLAFEFSFGRYNKNNVNCNPATPILGPAAPVPP